MHGFAIKDLAKQSGGLAATNSAMIGGWAWRRHPRGFHTLSKPSPLKSLAFAVANRFTP
jgi:hypothetical protein